MQLKNIQIITEWIIYQICSIPIVRKTIPIVRKTWSVGLVVAGFIVYKIFDFLKTRLNFGRSEVNYLHEINYHGNISSDIDEKVILLLGASGSGKTTLVKSAANYFEGVKNLDYAREIVKSSEGNTAHKFLFPNDTDTKTVISIIDTPGLIDSSGSDMNDNVNKLDILFSKIRTHELRIHAIAFVAQAHLGRLTSAERLVMDKVSNTFGQGIKESIIPFITFADGHPRPPVLEAMQEYGISIEPMFLFNNGVFNNLSHEVEDIERKHWHTGYKNWNKVMKILNGREPLSFNCS